MGLGRGYITFLVLFCLCPCYLRPAVAGDRMFKSVCCGHACIQFDQYCDENECDEEGLKTQTRESESQVSSSGLPVVMLSVE